MYSLHFNLCQQMSDDWYKLPCTDPSFLSLSQLVSLYLSGGEL